MNDRIEKARQIAKEAARHAKKLTNKWQGPTGFKYTPYPLKKLDTIENVPEFLSEAFASLFQRKRKHCDKNHKLFLRIVLSVFVHMGLRPYISSNKVHATMEALGCEVTRQTVNNWFDKLVETGLFGVDKSKSTGGYTKSKGDYVFTPASHRSCERQAHTYEIIDQRLKEWVASETRRILSPNLEDGRRFKTNIQFAYVIGNSRPEDWNWQISAIPGIFSPGKGGSDRYAEMQRMVISASQKIESLRPIFTYPWMLDDITVFRTPDDKYEVHFSLSGEVLRVFEGEYAIAEEGDITETFEEIPAMRNEIYKPRNKLARLLQKAA